MKIFLLQGFMRMLVLGCGNIGSVAAADLVDNTDYEIVVADNELKKAETLAERLGKSRVSAMKLDVSDRRGLMRWLKRFNVVLGFLPGKLAYDLAQSCIEAGSDLVDVSFMGENPLTLNNKASAADVVVVPDCGLAPGISNILVGHATKGFDRVESVHIMVGGIPEKPIPPLEYVITWSTESLIDEYTRKARIVRGGKRVDADVLGELEMVDFPGVGRLEAFLTDGLRTLLDTLKDVPDMWEKTLRYPGHAAKISTLRDLGFFEEGKVAVENVRVSPRRLAIKLLTDKLVRPDICDTVVARVDVSGVKDGKQSSRVYHMIDRCDAERGITAMARTTAYPASIVAQLLAEKAIKATGVIPPEKLGMDDEVFRRFYDELRARGIIIKEETNSIVG
jgi:saccharopine dehydrogenase-like NADP-dependent oxidoreductase